MDEQWKTIEGYERTYQMADGFIINYPTHQFLYSVCHRRQSRYFIVFGLV